MDDLVWILRKCVTSIWYFYDAIVDIDCMEGGDGRKAEQSVSALQGLCFVFSVLCCLLYLLMSRVVIFTYYMSTQYLLAGVCGALKEWVGLGW